MKKVRIDGFSIVEQSLMFILPEMFQDLCLIQGNATEADLQIVDLDYITTNQDEFEYDGKTPLIGLTFSFPENVKYNSGFFLNVPSVCFLQKPFEIASLYKLIKNGDQEFDAIYSHAGVNLFYHLKQFLEHGGSTYQETKIKQIIKTLYPDLFSQNKLDLKKCFVDLPRYILLPFYKDMAHTGGKTGLHGYLGMLEGAARDYNPKISNTISNLFKKIEPLSPKLPNILQILDSAQGVLNDLVSIVDDDEKETLKNFVILNKKWSASLICLNREIAVGKNEIDSDKIVGYSCDAENKLTKLLEAKNNLIKHIKIPSKMIKQFKKDRTMKVLLIDDNPEGRIERIEKTAKQMGRPIKVDLAEDNSTKNMMALDLNKYSFIILDWSFPKGSPQGKDTLLLLRKERKFEGVILIFTKAGGPFYQVNERNTHYYRDSMGDDSLTTILGIVFDASLQTINKNTSSEIVISDDSPPLPYYENLKEIKKHCYNPTSTLLGPASDKEALSQKVEFITTEWNAESGIEKLKKDKEHGTIGQIGQMILDIEVLAQSDIPVLISGKTGTGKELVAKLLHFHHSNKGNRYEFEESDQSDWFMALNSGAFSEGTLEIELFGSLPGAFTDGVDKAGIFEQVTKYKEIKSKSNGQIIGVEAINGGTVFLDELALMSLKTQIFLLRVLQEHSVQRAGHSYGIAGERNKKGEHTVKRTGEKIKYYKYGNLPVKYRLITATNESLLEKIEKNEFREDLYHRIVNAFIKLPSLQERSHEDFNILFQYFLLKANKRSERNIKMEHENGMLKSSSKDVIEHLKYAFPWIGNVRQLEGLVNSIVAYSDPNRSNDDYLSLKDIPHFHWEK